MASHICYIFATKRPVETKADGFAFELPTSPLYTIQELVSKFQTAGLAVAPCVH
jgi:hypothetical protein